MTNKDIGIANIDYLLSSYFDIGKLADLEYKHRQCLKSEQERRCKASMLLQNNHWELVDYVSFLDEQCDIMSYILSSIVYWAQENESFDDACNELTYTDVINKIDEIKKNLQEERMRVINKCEH